LVFPAPGGPKIAIDPHSSRAKACWNSSPRRELPEFALDHGVRPLRPADDLARLGRGGLRARDRLRDARPQARARDVERLAPAVLPEVLDRLGPPRDAGARRRDPVRPRDEAAAAAVGAPGVEGDLRRHPDPRRDRHRLDQVREPAERLEGVLEHGLP
jgi:hypothetical protein